MRPPASNSAQSPQLLVFALICGFLLLPQKSDAQFTYNSGGSVTENSALTGTGNLTVSNSTNLTLTNAGNTFNGSTTIQSGSLLLGNGGASGFIGSTSSITNNGTLVYNLTSSGTLGMVISGNGGLVKQSSGTLTLSGSNTYTGATTISAGTLALGASNVIANTSNVSVASGSTFALGGFSDTVGRLSGAGAVSLGSGTLTTNFSGGGGFLTFSGVISGTGGFTLAGASDFNDFLTLSGTNTYTGATALSGATLILGADNVISSSSNLVISGGRLSASNRNQTFHSLTMNSGAILRDGGALTFSNGAIFNGGSVTIRNSGGVINSSGTTTLGNVTFTYNASTAGLDALLLGGNVVVTSGASALFSMGPAGGQGYMKLGDTNRVFDVGENATATVNWVIHSTTLASGALTKNGSGTLVMNAVNTYTGGTTVNAGTLVLGNASNTLANAGALTVNGGTLSLGSNNDTIGALTLTGGSITGTTGVLTASSLTLQNGTVSAILAGSASINKTTSGTLTLGGNNTVSGGITLSVGQLNLNASGALGSGNFTIQGGSLGNTSGSSVTISSSASQFWNANFTYAGPNDLNLGTGAVAMNATRTITVDSGTLTVGGAISGSGFGLTKNGTGTLTLSGANTYNSTTTVNAGTLALGASNVIANSSDVVIGAGGVLSMSGFNDTIGKLTGAGSVALGVGTLTTTWGSGPGTFSGALSGSGGLTVAGAADYNAYFTLSGANTYTGATTLTGATLILGANNAISSSSNLVISGGRLSASSFNQTFNSITMDSGVIFRDGGTLAYTNGANLTGGSITIRNSGGTLSTGGLTTLGNVTLTYNATGANFNAMVLGGNMAVNAGSTALFVNGPAGGQGYVKLGNTNRIFDVGAEANLNMNWVITSDTLSAGALTKNGSGTLTLNGNNPYSGGTTINAGTLVLGHVTDTLANAGAVTVNGGTLSLGSNNDTIGALTLTGGSITGTTGVLTASSLTLQNGTVSAILAGSASINKTTSGTLTLSGNNTYTGATTIAAGTISINAAAALASTSAINLGDATSLTYTGGTATLDRNISVTSGTGSLRNTGNGTLTLGGTLSKNGTTLTFAQGVFNVTGSITGSSANSDLVVDSSTVTLSGVNTYDGPTYIINGGTLNANAVGALPTSPLSAVTVNGSSTLALGASQSVASLSGTNGSSVNLNANTLTINGSATTTYSGGISGTGNLVKNGNGTQTLAGATTFNGTITVNSGTLQITSTGLLGGGNYSGSITNNGSLLLASNSNQTLGGVISSNGALTKAGSGTLTLTAANTYTGATTINTGTLQIGAGGTSGAISSTSGITNNGTLAINRSDAITVANAISGSGDLIQNGNGTLVLNGVNTYTGGTTLNAGTLTIGNTAAAGSGSIVQTSNSSLLKVDVTGTINNAMSYYTMQASQNATLAGAQTVHNASFNVDDNTTLAISGDVSGSGGVTKTGNGTLILSGSNSYNGSIVVNAGTLNANSTNALGSNNTVQVTGGTLLVTADDALEGKNIELGGSGVGLQFSGTYNGSIGLLTLSANSTLDLGAGSVIARFSDIDFAGYNLSIYNWTGETLWGGTNRDNTDQVYIMAPVDPADLNRISFYSGNYGTDSFLGSGFELGFSSGFADQIIPVPEPETWLAAALLASFGLFGLLRKKFPKILKYEPRS
jgi:autotransporter-associated beta strand protein